LQLIRGESMLLVFAKVVQVDMARYIDMLGGTF
jgi:hypothetical protein